ncbi:DUF1127 domain-containing protein [Roseobacteraceae bacterium S113]
MQIEDTARQTPTNTFWTIRIFKMTISTHSTATTVATKPARRSFFSKLHQLFGLQRQRRALSRLSPEHLDDIGVTTSQARQEARKSFWDDTSS